MTYLKKGYRYKRKKKLVREWVTTSEYARLKGISRQQANKITRKGQLEKKPFGISGRFLVRDKVIREK